MSWTTERGLLPNIVKERRSQTEPFLVISGPKGVVEEVTFAQLDNASNRAAWFLSKNLDKDEDKFFYMGRMDVRYPIWALGAMKAGKCVSEARGSPGPIPNPFPNPFNPPKKSQRQYRNHMLSFPSRLWYLHQAILLPPTNSSFVMSVQRHCSSPAKASRSWSRCMPPRKIPCGGLKPPSTKISSARTKRRTSPFHTHSTKSRTSLSLAFIPPAQLDTPSRSTGHTRPFLFTSLKWMGPYVPRDHPGRRSSSRCLKGRACSHISHGIMYVPSLSCETPLSSS